MNTIPPTFEGAAIVELLGHRTFVGMCREVELCGARVLRIEVALPGNRIAPHLVPPSSIYALTPVPVEMIDEHWRERNEGTLFGYSLLAPEDIARREARLAERRAEALGRRREALAGLGIDVSDEVLDL